MAASPNPADQAVPIAPALPRRPINSVAVGADRCPALPPARPLLEHRTGVAAMTGFDVELVPGLTGSRALVGWMLVAFLLTFLATRAVTRAIRAGRGPFRDTSVGGVHVHHQVYGIFLLLGTGLAEFTYRPEPPWAQILAVLFGVGAALTLDEFALWLHLDDVYWSTEGRSSVDAVLVALVVGGLLLVGANPFDAQQAQGELAVALTIAVNVAFALVAILKGRVVLGVVGVFVPVLALVAALRLARPGSLWARRRYPPDSRRRARSHTRFPAGRRSRLDRLVDLFAVPPARLNQAVPPALLTPAVSPARPRPPASPARPPASHPPVAADPAAPVPPAPHAQPGSG